MSQNVPGTIKSFACATDLSAKQFYVMQVSADGTVALASAATQVLAGTQAGEAKSGESVSVVMSGTAKVKCGAGVTTGAELTCDSGGLGIATTTTGNKVIGIALEDGDTNDIIEYAVSLGVRY